MGALTQNNNIITGASVGEIQQAQPLRSNVFLGTQDAANSANWVQAGTITVSRVAGPSNGQWASACFPADIQAAAVGDNFNTNSFAGIIGNQSYSFGFEVSVDPNAFGGIPSSRGRVVFTWTGGVGRVDTLDFNPQNGQLLAASIGIVSVNFEILPIDTTFSTPLTVIRITGRIVTPVGANALNQAFFPDVINGTDGYTVGSVQTERGLFASDFNPTGEYAQETTRPFGVIARQVLDIGFNPQRSNAGNAQYTPTADKGKIFILDNGDTLTLPAMASAGTFGISDGEWCKVLLNTGTATIDASATGGIKYGLGAATPTLVLPAALTGANSVYAVTVMYNQVTQEWVVVDTMVAP